MAVSSIFPRQLGEETESLTLTPTSAAGVVNTVPKDRFSIFLGANVNGVNDFIVLPLLASVEKGHTIIVVSGTAASEVRTPSTSTNKINNVDCSDDAVEYNLAGTNAIHKFTKISNTVGWMGQGLTAIGATVTAVQPD